MREQVSKEIFIENNYDLKLTFDSSPSNQTALQEQMQASSIQGSITMGDNRNLDLTLKNKGAMLGDKLDITLNANSIFTLNTTSNNGNIGTIILQQANQHLNAKSSVYIQEGSANFIGVFDSTKDTSTSGSNIGSFTHLLEIRHKEIIVKSTDLSSTKVHLLSHSKAMHSLVKVKPKAWDTTKGVSNLLIWSLILQPLLLSISP